MVQLVARNQVFFVAKHYPGNLLRRYWWPILVGQSLWGIVALRHGAAWAFLKGKLAGLRAAANSGFRRLPSSYGAVFPPEQLAEILERSEREIRETQLRAGFDWYWSVYFLLTTGRIDTGQAK